jgi:hypothetical protein
MPSVISEGQLLWQYLSPNQRVLYGDGMFLLKDSLNHKDEEPTDYSYIVFPFAKMFEGFLKQLFLDLGIIGSREYNSDRFRIGRALSPTLSKYLNGKSAFLQIEKRYGKELANNIWQTWKEGRNLVFHYFPHNYRALTREQAEVLINLIIDTMDGAVRLTRVRPHNHQDEDNFARVGEWKHQKV